MSRYRVRGRDCAAWIGQLSQIARSQDLHFAVRPCLNLRMCGSDARYTHEGRSGYADSRELSRCRAVLINIPMHDEGPHEEITKETKAWLDYGEPGFLDLNIQKFHL